MNNQYGHHLTKWEIKQRLLKSKIPFDNTIQSKDYFINLYNKLLCNNENTHDYNLNQNSNQMQLENNITIINDQEMKNEMKNPRIQRNPISYDNNGNYKERMNVNYNGMNRSTQINNNSQKIVFTKPPIKKLPQNQLQPIQRNNDDKSTPYIKRRSICLGFGIIAILFTANSRYISNGFNLDSIRENVQLNLSNAQSVITNAVNYLSRLNRYDISFILIVLFFTILLIHLFKACIKKNGNVYLSNSDNNNDDYNYH